MVTGGVFFAVVHLPLASRRHVTRADLRNYGVTIGSAACSDIAVHGKTAQPPTGMSLGQGWKANGA